MFEIIKIRTFRLALRILARIAWMGKVPRNLTVVTTRIQGPESPISIRIYTPLGSGPFPMIVFYHGGGFVIGDIQSHDPLCRELCVKSRRVVVSVDYRLAPEFPFPAAPMDCFAALQWVAEHADELQGNKLEIVVAGDSAGGNLAAVTALQARKKLPGLLQGQILLSPVTNHYQSVTDSYIQNATGQGLTRKSMIWFWDLYLRNSPLMKAGETTHELATPLTEDDLSDLPPAFVLTAEKDPLLDEGNAYAERLARHGVEVHHTIYQGVQHSPVGLVPNINHRNGMAEIIAWLQRLPQRY